jgi:hypothetical protein
VVTAGVQSLQEGQEVRLMASGEARGARQ